MCFVEDFFSVQAIGICLFFFKTLPFNTRLCHFLSPEVSIVVDFNSVFVFKVEFQSQIVVILRFGFVGD